MHRRVDLTKAGGRQPRALQNSVLPRYTQLADLERGPVSNSSNTNAARTVPYSLPLYEKFRNGTGFEIFTSTCVHPY